MGIFTGRVAMALLNQSHRGSTAPEMARAAVEAMREPTGAMKAAASGYMNAETEQTGREMAAHAWRAMIDAALKEE